MDGILKSLKMEMILNGQLKAAIEIALQKRKRERPSLDYRANPYWLSGSPHRKQDTCSAHVAHLFRYSDASEAHKRKS